MKMNLQPKLLPFLVAGMGGLAFAVRWGLYAFGVDHKDLLMPWHPFGIMLGILAAAVAVLVVSMVWKLDGSRKYANNFKPSVVCALGNYVLAVNIVFTVVSSWQVYTTVEWLRNILGVLAAGGMVFIGLCRQWGKRPVFLFHGLLCAYFALYMVTRYRAWSSNPQLQDYVFTMAASVFLTLFAYYHTAFDVGMGSRRMHLGTGLLAAFCCLAALPSTEFPLLYVGGCLWALTNLCSLTPIPVTKKQIEEPKE